MKKLQIPVLVFIVRTVNAAADTLISNNLAFIGLEKNETAPIPVPATPRVPSENEKEQAVEVSIAAKDSVRKILFSCFKTC